MRHLFTSILNRTRLPPTYLYWLASKDHKAFCSLRQETHELVGQDLFNLIRLLDRNADTQRVHRGFDQDLFLVVTANDHRVQHDFLRCAVVFCFWVIGKNISIEC